MRPRQTFALLWLEYARLGFSHTRSGLSYTAHWEALGCALCLLTTLEISSTGPVRGRGFCPGSHRPRARVPLVVWAWDFFLCGFLAAVSRPLLSHCFSLCDLRLFVNKRMLLFY